MQMNLWGQLTVEAMKVSALKRGTGCESEYLQITSDWGVKIFRNPFHCSARFQNFLSEQSLMESSLWARVCEQVRLMKYFESLNRGPKVYDMFIVFDEENDCYFPAVKMEHIEYKPYGMLNNNKIRGYNRFVEALDQRFGNTDHHADNVVYDARDNRFKIIDFGAFEPQLVTAEGRAAQKKMREDGRRIRREMELELKRDREAARANQPIGGTIIVGDLHIPNYNAQPKKFRDVFIDFRINFDHMMMDALIGHRHEPGQGRLFKIEEPPVDPVNLPEPIMKKRAEKRQFMERVQKFVSKPDWRQRNNFKRAA